MAHPTSEELGTMKKRGDEVVLWLQGEFSSIRTGRSSPSILDGVRVNIYGSQMPITHIATVSIEDPRTIRVAPWDKTQTRDIEKAINDEGLGLSVNVSDVGVRVIFPELTSERRVALLKVAKAKHEEARISLRKARDTAWGSIQDKEKKKEIAEDDKFRLKDELQRIVDGVNGALDEMLAKKEKEISA